MIIDLESEAELVSIKKRFTDDHLQCLNLKAIDENEWIIFKYEVEADYSLKKLIEKKNQIFKRGHAFYEFTNEIESITEDQQLILWEIVYTIVYHYIHVATLLVL
jgi:AAA+ ATPase superfamily predicted ATPase